ncbi:sensor histidine kinase [Paenibacillus sp. GCM10012306]|uniref:sensor histidine kinase n=1 Tax=Paenibacillus sp. GCM10012306 TaxID=3317342 RepID=UPI0036D3C893
MKIKNIKMLVYIQKYIRNLSLQAKLILSFMILIFIPVLIFSSYSFSHENSKSMDELIRNNETILDIEKTNIENNIELMEWTAQLALSNREMNDFLQSQKDFNTEALLEIKTKLIREFQYYLFNNPRVSKVRLFTSNPNVQEFWPVLLQEFRIQNKYWYKDVLEQEGSSYWVMGEQEGVLVDAPSEPVRFDASLLKEFKFLDDTTHNGILEISMSMQNFFLKTFSKVQDPSSQLVIVTRDHKVFSLDSSVMFNNVSAEQYIESVILSNEPSNEVVKFYTAGQPYLAIQSYIQSIDVHLVNIVSLADTMADIKERRNKLIIIIIFLMAFLSLLSYFMQSMILKRLRVLKDSMKKVRGGNFNVDLPITGTDEIGELGHHYRKLLSKINELIEEQANRQAAGKEAELKALKNQIDSHFLYNTLENLKMLAEMEGQYVISDTLTSLGGMMRYTLQWTREHVKLKEELNHVHHYIDIMNIRYNGKIELGVVVDPALLNQESLKMSLQPIVENAIKHGMKQMNSKSGKFIISITAMAEKNNCLIEIMDNGCGIPEEKIRILSNLLRMEERDYQELRGKVQNGGGSGIGLRNVDQRLIMSYGLNYGIRIESMVGSYTRVVMSMPLLKFEGRKDIDD